jgi:hypothetical protein
VTRTSTPVGTEPPAPAAGEAPRRRRFTIGRVGAAVVILGILGMWAYVLGLRWTGERDIDRWDVVDDAAWVEAATAACAPTAAELEGTDEPEGTSAERADAIDAVTDLLVIRFDALEALPPTTSADADDAVAISGWLADWETHIAERREYADDLRAGRDGVFLGAATEDGESITERMDAFADRNTLPGCATVHDLRTS